MVTIKENGSLKNYNTFGVEARAKYFCSITSEDELLELLRTDLFRNEKKLFLGGGSNVLFTRDFDGLVIHNSILGIETYGENEEIIRLNVASGVNWHVFVLHCVHHNLGGIENLSLIPGTIGAAPIQNIGAYGVEISEVIENVEAIDITDGSKELFTNEECKFGYRESVFKNDLKEKKFISSVTLRLTKKNHRVNTSYGAIKETLNQMRITNPTIQSVSDAVIKIRREKLPDYNLLGNAGSFFKNPEITEAHFRELKNKFDSMPHYHTANQRVKVPAAWLIEQCGWKGKKINQIGVHDMQPLVLVNFGHGKGSEVFHLAMKIKETVREKFSITLMPEVNIF